MVEGMVEGVLVGNASLDVYKITPLHRVDHIPSDARRDATEDTRITLAG